MSAASRPIQGTPSLNRLAIAFGALALAVGLALVLAYSQVGASKSQAGPAAGAAPVLHDHGWSSASQASPSGQAVQHDHGAMNASTGVSTPSGIIVRGSRGGAIRYVGIPYAAPDQGRTGSSHGLRLPR